MKVKLIKKNDVMIVWEPYRLELHVYEYTQDERIRYSKGDCDVLDKLNRYRHCNFSNGNCESLWKGMTKDQLIAMCFKIIFEYKFKDLKMCFYEFGKIEELECMRILLFKHFPDFLPDSSYEEFVEQVYS